MRQSLIALAGILFIAFASCEYEPKGIFEQDLKRDVSSPDIETIELDLDEEKDTIDLLYNRVYFHFKSSDQRIKLVNFYLNDSLVGTAKSGKGYYDLYSSNLYRGTHNLKLEILASSGTGSIADSLAAEGFLFTSKEWIIRVRPTEYYNLTTTSENGYLKLRWAEYFDQDIQKNVEYVISRSNKEVGRTTICEFIDSSYVGEGGEYQVSYHYGDRAYVSLGYVHIPNEIDFDFVADANNNYALDWSKYKYHAAIDSVTIYITTSFSYPFKNYKVTDPNQKRFPIPTSDFGLLKIFKVKLIPNAKNRIYNPLQKENSPFVTPYKYHVIGSPFPIFEHFNHLNNNEFLFHTTRYNHNNIYYPDTLYRYSVARNKISGRTRYKLPNYNGTGDYYDNITTTPDGKNYMAHAVQSGRVIYGSTSDFNSYKIINVSSVNTGTNSIPVSNEGTGILQDGYNKYLYDFKNVKVLGTLKDAVAYESMAISADGVYFLFKSWFSFDLFKYSDNTITKANHYYTGPRVNYAEFFPDEPRRLLCWSKETKQIDVLSCPNLTPVQSFVIEENELLDVDYSMNRILTFSDNLLVVRSLADGTIQQKITVGFTHFDKYKCYLTGNSIFHELGARYFLK